MSTLYATKSQYSRYTSRILDELGRPIFTTLHHPQKFQKDITAIYRDSDEFNNILAILKGDTVVVGDSCRKQREYFTDTTANWRRYPLSCNSLDKHRNADTLVLDIRCQSFVTPVGVLTWQRLQDGYQVRIPYQLLSYSGKNFTLRQENDCPQ